MKYFSTLLALASLATAGPISERQDGLKIHRFKVVAPNDAEVNNAYLSIGDNNTVGIFGSPDPSKAQQFYTSMPIQIAIPPTRYEVHTYPIGIVDHALAVFGSGGLRPLKDVANPSQVTFPEGADWRSFTLGPADADGQVSLGYNGAEGEWLALQTGESEFHVAWYDGESIITQNYRQIRIVSEVVTD